MAKHDPRLVTAYFATVFAAVIAMALFSTQAPGWTMYANPAGDVVIGKWLFLSGAAFVVGQMSISIFVLWDAAK